MSTSAPVKISVIAMILLLALPLAAQRYQERDHHIFHPPVQAKRQAAPPTGSTTQTRVSSTGNPSGSRGHDANLSASHNETAHTQMPSGAGPVRPH